MKGSEQNSRTQLKCTAGDVYMRLIAISKASTTAANKQANKRKKNQIYELRQNGQVNNNIKKENLNSTTNISLLIKVIDVC